MEEKQGGENVNWFLFENRIRKMVIELLEPIVKRSNDDREVVLGIKMLSETQKRKLDELEYLTHKSQKRLGSLDMVTKRINEFDIEKKKLEEVKHAEMEHVSMGIDLLKEKIRQSQEKMITFEFSFDHYTSEFKKLLELFDGLKTHLNNSL